MPVNRRKFLVLTVVGLLPRDVLAQQRARVPTIGIIFGDSPDDVETQSRVKAFESAWQELGWVEGRTIHADYRWSTVAGMRAVCAALVASAPDVILVNGISLASVMRDVTQSIPVVFTGISDPEGVGIVASLAHPGGNMTGFANFEPSIGGKWLQTLRELAPNLSRVGVLRIGKTHPRILDNVRLVAATNSIEVVDCSVSDDVTLQAAIGAFAGHPTTGLIVLPDPFFGTHRDIVLQMAAGQGHPAIYPFRTYTERGGLVSYGLNILDQVRRSALYVDKILKGARPGDLPVQAPTKFEFVINLKTARALGLDVSPTLLARADDVIE